MNERRLITDTHPTQDIVAKSCREPDRVQEAKGVPHQPETFNQSKSFQDR